MRSSCGCFCPLVCRCLPPLLPLSRCLEGDFGVCVCFAASCSVVSADFQLFVLIPSLSLGSAGIIGMNFPARLLTGGFLVTSKWLFFGRLSIGMSYIWKHWVCLRSSLDDLGATTGGLGLLTDLTSLSAAGSHPTRQWKCKDAVQMLMSPCPLPLIIAAS